MGLVAPMHVHADGQMKMLGVFLITVTVHMRDDKIRMLPLSPCIEYTGKS
jgi:hypothetical protein